MKQIRTIAKSNCCRDAHRVVEQFRGDFRSLPRLRKSKSPSCTTTARPGGFTLIEMLTVITIFSFLLASAALAIGALFRTQGELQDELIAANTSSRLAAQLRADAHLANSAEVTHDGDTTSVRLRLPNAEIHYLTQPRRIVRTVTQGETVTHREVFALLEGTTADWELSAEQPAFITLTTSFVSPALRASVARPRERRMEASIGLHTGGVR